MTNSKTTVRDLRRQNRQTLLQHTYFAQPISRLDLSQQLGISPATVTNVVVELLDEGVLLETGVEESQGGRPRTLLTVNPRFGYFIGIDVGETQTQVELFDVNLNRLGGVHYSVAPDGDPIEQVIDHADLGVSSLLATSGVARARVLGVGVGVPGIVERASDQVVYAPSWRWEGVPLQSALHDRLHLPVLVDNGAKAMAQAELWFGAGRSVESLAVLVIGTGVGAGIIADGTLYRGATNSAGEWGHTKIVLDGWACRCGGRGCIEAYVGAPGIVRRYRELAPGHALPDIQEQALAAIHAAAQAKQPAAQQVLAETARYLGAGIANLINLLNPQMIVLGGWVGLLLGPTLLPEVQRNAAVHALRQPFESVRFGVCELGLDAICQGAATLVLDLFLASGGRMHGLPAATLARARVPASVDASGRSRP